MQSANLFSNDSQQTQSLEKSNSDKVVIDSEIKPKGFDVDCAKSEQKPKTEITENLTTVKETDIAIEKSDGVKKEDKKVVIFLTSHQLC